MANIFNDSSEPIREASGQMNGNFTNLTVDNLIVNNEAVDNLNVGMTLVTPGIQISGISNHSILVAGTSGNINGLLPGSANTILKSNGTDALWTNSLILQDLQTNTLKIPTTTTGDLLIFNSSSQAQRLAVGSSGQFLISDGTNPTWNSLPNPLIVGGLQINGNTQLTLFPNRTLITDNTGFIVSEQQQYAANSSSFSTTPTQIYGVASWQMTNNAWYSIKVQINTTTNFAFTGLIQINAVTIGYINNIGGGNNTWYCEFTYNHTGSTGAQGIALSNFVTSSGTANVSFSIRVSRMETPNIHS
jgi:hypothetical protein